ncbi:hypothetical protein TIFTF001_033870 [Ficus carica]|uniref:Uncharacterized protein n=1 Tax=Ficus carica TaxID=3494 RepID=A0AA88E034_FICCA|nr:hypothetical protein TIFTF001_033870 [Ficus carica]
MENRDLAAARILTSRWQELRPRHHRHRKIGQMASNRLGRQEASRRRDREPPVAGEIANALVAGGIAKPHLPRRSAASSGIDLVA